MLLIGLTGGISTGKSTVSKRIQEKHQIPVIDADVIARQVVEPGTKAYKQIVAHFGPEVVLEGGGLDRPALGRAVFGNEPQRQKLNSIVHPAVRMEMAKQVLWAWVCGHKCAVLDVPLLFESKLDQFCGTVVVVGCNEEQQLDRLVNRDAHLSLEDAQKRIASQMSLAEKRQRADHYVDNSSSLEHLYKQVDDLFGSTLQPYTVVALAEWLVPPFGLVMALLTYVSRTRTAKPKLA